MENIYSCFNCSKTFKQSEMLEEEIPNNFQALATESEKTGKVDACPKCGAVAFFGFRPIGGE